MISRQTIDAVQSRLDALSLASDYVRLEQKGGRWWGCCPFHNEKTPSFTVDPDRKMYHCFGCGAGGGMVNFLMEMEKCTFPEAIEHLAKRLGLEVIYEDRSGPDSAAVKRGELFELYKRAAGSFHHILTKTAQGSAALEYVRNRAISDEMIEKFRLGYSPADRFWLHKFLSGKGYSPEFLAESGLFAKKNSAYAFFADRLMFPIAARDGSTVGFGARLLSGDGPKYLNSGESQIYKKRETLFALDLALPEIRREKSVYICEGYMDTIALHQAGLANSAAPLGTAFTLEQARLLARWAESVTLLFDSDSAGQSAACKAILTARQAGLKCRVVKGCLGEAADQNTAPTKDPADILRAFGSEGLTNFAKNSIIDYEFLSALSLKSFPAATPEGRARAARFLFPFLETVDSEVERQGFLRDIADKLREAPEAVTEDYAAWRSRKPVDTLRGGKGGGGYQRENTGEADGKTESAPVSMNGELYAVLAVFVTAPQNPALYEKLSAHLSPSDFDDRNARALVIALEEWRRAGENGPDSLLRRVENERLREVAAEKAVSGEFAVNTENIVLDSLRQLRVKRLEKRRTALVSMMRVAKNAGEDTEEMLAEKRDMDEEIAKAKGWMAENDESG